MFLTDVVSVDNVTFVLTVNNKGL